MIVATLFVSAPLPDAILRGLVLTAGAMVWVVLLVRINGLRSFSKMTNFDFVMTVAVGSLLAGTGQSTEVSGFLQGLAGMAALFGVQYVAARLRTASDTFEEAVQNSPVLLARDGVFIDEALKDTRVSKDDLIAKLREANVLSMQSVRAVVLETTGDVSVMHGDSLDEFLLKGTRRVDQ